MKKVINFLSLFTSFSTLLCCALPALLVGLGMGAAMAGFLSKYPQLIWVSENKVVLFISGAILLIISGYFQFSNKNECPIDKKEACEEVKGYSKYLFIISVLIYLVGFSFAFIIPHFL